MAGEVCHRPLMEEMLGEGRAYRRRSLGACRVRVNGQRWTRVFSSLAQALPLLLGLPMCPLSKDPRSLPSQFSCPPPSSALCCRGEVGEEGRLHHRTLCAGLLRGCIKGSLSPNPRKLQKKPMVWERSQQCQQPPAPCTLLFPALAWKASLNVVCPSGDSSLRFHLEPAGQKMNFLPFLVSVCQAKMSIPP